MTRLPAKILKLQGTARKCRLKARGPELELEASMPDPPAFLKGAALEEWQRLAAISKYKAALSPVDRGLLTTYCLLWGEIQQHAENGTTMPTPRYRIFMAAASKIGAAPTDRVKMPAPPEPKKPNPFADL